MQYFSCTTTVEAQPAQQCGRAVFADLYANTGDSSAPDLLYPSEGYTTPEYTLTTAARAVLCTLFDPGRCIGDDRD